MTKTVQNRIRLRCPHCGSSARIRNSESVSPLYRDAWVECQNWQCGWRGKCAIQFISTTTPSHNPNPEIQLPLSPAATKKGEHP